MAKYKIREKSIAWYAKKYWKVATVAGLSVAVLASAIAFAESEPSVPKMEKKPSEANLVVGSVSWDVPLDKDLQLYIYELGERYNIEPELILAVIGIESNYKADVIGDNGNSYGLMQVQPKWHEERMVQYNVTDLLNPYENALIGTDYLAECIEKGGLEWGLMCYNGGQAQANGYTEMGVVSEYAESVMVLSEFLKGGK
jgi:soluble lytic murein transglycosylase-like protein